MSWRTTERIEIEWVISKTVLAREKDLINSFVVVIWSLLKKPRKEKKETWIWTIGKHKNKMGFIYPRHDHTFVNDFLESSSPIDEVPEPKSCLVGWGSELTTKERILKTSLVQNGGALQDCDLCKITICSSFRAVRGACEMSHILPRGVGGEGVQGASPCSVLSQPPAPSSLLCL